MRLVLVVAAIMVLAPSVALAGDEEQLAQIAKVEGQFDEGEVELRSRRCGFNPRDGKYRHYLTIAGPVSAQYYAHADEFRVNHQYRCRMRTRTVSGCGGVQIGTDDSHTDGAVVVRVTISRMGVVKVLGTEGLQERCGTTLAQMVAAKLEGVTLSR